MPRMSSAQRAAPRGDVRRHASPLETALIPAAADPASLPGHVLALVRFDPGRPATGDTPALEVVTPFAQLEREPLVEVWSTPAPPWRGVAGRMQFAATDAVLFGAIEVEIGPAGALEQATLGCYTELLQQLDAVGFPHLLRIWNAVPGINEAEDGLERYKLFCRGRSVAFERRLGPGFVRALPAASAVGCEGSRLVVHFLAARARAHHFENPRQVAAWAYPSLYGPRSPSFARATAAPAALGGALFVSGTASVVGHASVHGGDPAAQLAETLNNIGALLRHAGAAATRLQQLRVYVRRPADAVALRSVIERVTEGRVPLLFLRGDICRAELLLEIEAVV